MLIKQSLKFIKTKNQSSRAGTRCACRGRAQWPRRGTALPRAGATCRGGDGRSQGARTATGRGAEGAAWGGEGAGGAAPEGRDDHAAGAGSHTHGQATPPGARTRGGRRGAHKEGKGRKRKRERERERERGRGAHLGDPNPVITVTKSPRAQRGRERGGGEGVVRGKNQMREIERRGRMGRSRGARARPGRAGSRRGSKSHDTHNQ
jgi:hypothetical protein